MVELWLNFKDENGEPQRISVAQEKFTIGRTPENDLGIPLANLSRQHAKIDRFADIFVIADSGSSNGTTLNGNKMSDPIALKNGDKVNLGGGLEIEIELISDQDDANAEGGAGGKSSGGADGDDDENSSAAAATAGSSSSSTSTGASGSGSSLLFILAPLLGIFILLIGGGIFLISRGSGGNNADITKKGTTPSYESDDELPKNKKTPKSEESVSPSTTETPTTPSSGNGGGTTTNPTAEVTATPYVADEPTSSTKPANTGDSDKVRASSAQFLRRISTKDPNAFLGIKEANIVTDKIKTVKNWSALAENLKDAKRNSAKIKDLAISKSLTPQFLVTAALSELGSQRGDVLGKATEMSDVLANLKQVLGDEIADDSLLTIAALDEGRAGQFNQMRDLLTKLVDQSSSSPRVVRTIWFLNDNKKITSDQFDRALKFLAVGTIAQNPKEFSVSAEAISF